VVCKGSNLHFEELPNAAESINLTILPRLHDSHWKEVATSYLNKKHASHLENKDLLWGAQFIYNSSSLKSEMIFSFNQAIVDGISMITISKDFLKLCYFVAQGNPPSIVSLPLHKSLDELLSSQIRTLPISLWNILPFSKSFVGFKLRSIFKSFQPIRSNALPLAGKAPSNEREDGFVTGRISAADYAKLRKKWKNNSSTFSSLLGSAYVMSLQQIMNLPEGFNIALRFPINMRKYCQPIVMNNEVGCFTSSELVYHQCSLKNTLLSTKLRAAESLALQNVKNCEGRVCWTKNYSKSVIEDRKTEARTTHTTLSSWGDFAMEDCGPFKFDQIFSVQSQKVFGSLVSLHAVSLESDVHLSLVFTKPLMTEQTAQKIMKFMLTTLMASIEGN